jgi:hypothetical protein
MRHHAANKGRRAMANEMPDPDTYSGLSRKVLQYAEAFRQLASRLKQPDYAEHDWDAIEALVDVENFQREGVFATDKSEQFGWPTYREYVTKYAGNTSWEGTLRRITEVPNLVVLELEERNSRGGVTDVSQTVTIYKFNAAGKLQHLDVYVRH